MINRDLITKMAAQLDVMMTPDRAGAWRGLVRWADEARKELEDALTLSKRYVHPGQRPSPLTERLAALLAEWPKEADRG